MFRGPKSKKGAGWGLCVERLIAIGWRSPVLRPKPPDRRELRDNPARIAQTAFQFPLSVSVSSGGGKKRETRSVPYSNVVSSPSRPSCSLARHGILSPTPSPPSLMCLYRRVRLLYDLAPAEKGVSHKYPQTQARAHDSRSSRTQLPNTNEFLESSLLYCGN